MLLVPQDYRQEGPGARYHCNDGDEDAGAVANSHLVHRKQLLRKP
jgi:hypothetical protein